MRRRNKATLVILGMAFTFFCTTISTTHAQTSLQDLFDGGSLVIDDAVFFNFALSGDDGTLSPNFSNIDVNAFSSFGGAGLEFQGNGEFALGAGFDALIFGFEYDAIFGTDQGVAISDVSAGNPMVDDEGYLNVNSLVMTGALLAEVNAELDPLFGINNPTVARFFSEDASSFSIQTSFSLFADSNANVSVDSFRTTTSAVPEPSSFMVIGILAGAVMNRRRRKA